MQRHDAVIVGGGPAGSACAGRLVQAGLDVAVLDRETFPRLKLCAGWITPEVLQTLGLNPTQYPHGLHSFDHLAVHVKGLTLRVPTVQHSIRRVEFDDFLLKRSGARVIPHQVRHIEPAGEDYIVDGRFRTRFLVGAGGTRCPVHKQLFRERHPRIPDLQVAALEQEFEYGWSDPRCHLWFFDHGLPGYAWYVPKAGGWLNCGIGAMAGRLKARGGDLYAHWQRFAGMLEERGLVRGGANLAPHGYSYYLRSRVSNLRNGNAFVVGDAAGLATVDLGEGIGPAIKSGLSAAAAILGAEYRLERVERTSADQLVHNPRLGRGNNLCERLTKRMEGGLARRFFASPLAGEAAAQRRERGKRPARSRALQEILLL